MRDRRHLRWFVQERIDISAQQSGVYFLIIAFAARQTVHTENCEAIRQAGEERGGTQRKA
ncbi:MAG: hypothetical protein H6601_01825 [Flavobacteriales bacterium]|nr:hypothetical protein [Flavobacteriales bacterium]